ncbi:MAG: matrixin family metalloprotease [Nitrososphaerales archaeon]
MICLSSTASKEYEDLFVKAVEEWKSRWDHFSYTISNGSGCHINVHIVSTHSKVTGHGYSGYTYIEYWDQSSITKADIILPTHSKIVFSEVVKGKRVTTESTQPLSKELFYRAALHEFGHALNLGHFDDNGEEPIDIMYAYPADDDQEQAISQRDIEALNWLYLGFFESHLTVRTDKRHYNIGDMIKIYGKVGPVVLQKEVKVEVIGKNDELYTDNISISSDGTFSSRMKMPTEANGSFKVMAFYNGIIADAVFYVGDQDKVSEAGLSQSSFNISNGSKESSVKILKTLLVDAAGSEVTSVGAKEQVFIHSSLLSNLPSPVEATYIIQIKNAAGHTAELSYVTYDLVNGSSTFTQSWIPNEPDIYYIQIFIWNNSPKPEPLTESPVELQFVVY